MPVCTNCSSAIIKLLPQDRRAVLSDGPIDITLPKLATSTVRDCWICARFSKWLENEHPELLDTWLTQKLGVTYSVMASAHIDESNYPRLRLFLMNITAQGLDHDDDACGADMTLLPAEGNFEG